VQTIMPCALCKPFFTLHCFATMINIRVQTAVAAPLHQVKAQFNESLLQKLNPPFPRATLLRYDGEQPGNEICIELHFIFFRQIWISSIIAHHESDSLYSFTDQGIQLPFFLNAWQHEHRLQQLPKGGTLITDALHFQTPFWFPKPLAKLAFRLLMLYRRPVYRKVFGKP
jgi:ligand-binding SRPBCC domain-containing protein